MAKIKLTESVSVSELKHMREVEGLSNAEIAKRVGCAVSTVIDYIGKQPVEMTKRNQMACMRKTKELPPLTGTKTEIPDMPRESFKERCERLMARAEESPTPVADLMAKADEKKTDVTEKIRSKAADLYVIIRELPTLSVDARIEARRNAQRLMDEITELKKLQAEDASKEADKAREAHCKEMGKAAAEEIPLGPIMRNMTNVALEAHCLNEQVQKNHRIVSELLVVFGPDSVREYLRVSLYAMGIPYCCELKREVMLDALNKLNKEATCND